YSTLRDYSIHRCHDLPTPLYRIHRMLRHRTVQQGSDQGQFQASVPLNWQTAQQGRQKLAHATRQDGQPCRLMHASRQSAEVCPHGTGQ
ncbi:hypothetical protein PFISCL1PPCAC_4617, partial [Pristionchus fissidentatus]